MQMDILFRHGTPIWTFALHRYSFFCRSFLERAESTGSEQCWRGFRHFRTVPVSDVSAQSRPLLLVCERLFSFYLLLSVNVFWARATAWTISLFPRLSSPSSSFFFSRLVARNAHFSLFPRFTWKCDTLFVFGFALRRPSPFSAFLTCAIIQRSKSINQCVVQSFSKDKRNLGFRAQPQCAWPKWT